MNKEFKRMIEDAKNHFDEYEFLKNTEIDVFCEENGIVQLPCTDIVITAIFGIDGMSEAKNNYLWQTKVGLVKSIHTFVETLDNKVESISDAVNNMSKIYETDEYHGELAYDEYFDNCISISDLRMFLEDFYHVEDETISDFLWNISYLISNIFLVENGEIFNDKNAHEIITPYSDLINIFVKDHC